MSAGLEAGAPLMFSGGRDVPGPSRRAVAPQFVEPPARAVVIPHRGGHKFRDHQRVPAASGLRRWRLLDRCVGAHDVGSLIVTGPPGAGKSELLAQFAEVLQDRGEQVAWFHADGSLQSPQDVFDGVADAFLGTTSDRARATSIRRLVAELERITRPCTLIIDDAQVLTGELAATICRIVESLPKHTRIAFAGRAENPEWSTPLWLAGPVHKLDMEDLRFRPDEVERLFSEHYAEPVPAAAVSALTTRTEGWIIAIHLLRLATLGQSLTERVAAIDELGSSRLLRHYLAANVFAGIPPDTVDLLLFGSVLSPIIPQWCDALLDRVNSGWILDQLVEQNLLVRRSDVGDQARYHYHPMLRQYLLAELRARIGVDALREFHRKAARLYETIGCGDEALLAYSRAADVRAANRMAGAARSGLGPTTTESGSEAGVVILARARKNAVDGRLEAALAAYRDAASALVESDLREDCLQERELVAAWSSGVANADDVTTHWLSQLRFALARRPAALAGHPLADSGGGWSLAAGIASLLDGRPDQAARRWARFSPTRVDLVGLIGNGLRVVAENWTTPDVMVSGLEAIASQADTDRLDGVSSVMRSLRALSGIRSHIEAAERVERNCHAGGQLWLSLIAGAAAAIGRCRGGLDAVDPLRRCERLAEQLGAGVVQAWALVVMARYAAKAGSLPESELAALNENAQAALRVAGASAVIPTHDGWLAQPPAESRQEPRLSASPSLIVAEPREAAMLRIRCLGRFELLSGDRPLDWHSLRPRVQSVLRLLALRSGQGVHVETLYECFWPGASLDSARRSLHVAISMIRRVVGVVPGTGERSVLERRGDMYVLLPPPSGDVDVVRFNSAVRRWRAQRQSVELAEQAKPLREALSLYTGDLLPEDGAAEWVLADRARYRGMVLDVAGVLAATELKLGNPAAAAEVSARAIDIDRFHDQSWRLLIRASLARNDVGAAERARSQYRDILAELGVSDGPDSEARERAG